MEEEEDENLLLSTRDEDGSESPDFAPWQKASSSSSADIDSAFSGDSGLCQSSNEEGSASASPREDSMIKTGHQRSLKSNPRCLGSEFGTQHSPREGHSCDKSSILLSVTKLKSSSDEDVIEATPGHPEDDGKDEIDHSLKQRRDTRVGGAQSKVSPPGMSPGAPRGPVSHSIKHSQDKYRSLSSADTKMGEGGSEVPHGSAVVSDNNNSKAVNSVDEEVLKLQGALAMMQEKLHTKDAEISRLSRIRTDVESELEDLTASLFEEAHKMVRDANVKQAASEKALVEANMKIDVLETEVSALKTLVLTSTPSQPNKHLHPQLASGGKSSNKKANSLGGRGKLNASLNVSVGSSSLGNSSDSVASGSNGQHQYGINVGQEEETGPASTAGSSSSSSPDQSLNCSLGSTNSDEQGLCQNNMDPTLRKDFLSWRKTPTLDPAHPFLARIFREDVDACLAFPNVRLALRVTEAIKENALCLTPVKDFTGVPRDCALLQAPVLCRYYLKLLTQKEGEDSKDEVYHIGQLSRNRLAAVCDLLSYMRYVRNGLVKAHVNEVYWEIMRLRRKVVMARLGFSAADDC